MAAALSSLSHAFQALDRYLYDVFWSPEPWGENLDEVEALVHFWKRLQCLRT